MENPVSFVKCSGPSDRHEFRPQPSPSTTLTSSTPTLRRGAARLRMRMERGDDIDSHRTDILVSVSELVGEWRYLLASVWRGSELVANGCASAGGERSPIGGFVGGWLGSCQSPMKVLRRAIEHGVVPARIAELDLSSKVGRTERVAPHRYCSARPFPSRGGLGGAEPVGVGAGFEDVRVERDSVDNRRNQSRIGKHRSPLAEG
jgi:hypothetical protein